MMKGFFLLMVLFLGTSLLNAWEEDPRNAEHNKRTAYLLKIGDKQAEEGNEETVALLAYAFKAKNQSIEETLVDE